MHLNQFILNLADFLFCRCDIFRMADSISNAVLHITWSISYAGINGGFTFVFVSYFVTVRQ